MAFTGNYGEYFGFATDVDAVVYLMLVNDLIHGLYPEAVAIGEDVSAYGICFSVILILHTNQLISFSWVKAVSIYSQPDIKYNIFVPN